jgi:outer membrane protein
MKNNLILTVLLLLAGAFSLQAQSQIKIGYADVDYILSQMPETRQVEADLQAHSTQLQNQYQAKVKEFQDKLDKYQREAANMVDAVRQDRERELQQLETNIQKFQQDAQASIQKKQTDLMQPLYDKVGKMIESVAKEQQYTYILSTGVGGLDVILYASEEHDISDSVLSKMGVTPKK